MARIFGLGYLLSRINNNTTVPVIIMGGAALIGAGDVTAAMQRTSSAAP